MTGRRHAPPDHQQQYTRDQVSARGLACPFAMSDPDAYMNITACRATEGFKSLRELNEHIWRKHTPFYRCGFCHVRWSISTARGKVTQMKEQHWETCEGRRRGTPYFERRDEDGTELLDRNQQRRFAETKSIRRNEDKLKALYEACDKPPPESYYVPDALPAVQPHVTYRTVTRTTTIRRVQQPDSHREDLFTGFVQPRAEGHQRAQQWRTTAHNVSRSNAQAPRGDYEVSGANRQPDTDSGYVSMPRDDGDASELSPADGYPFQQPGGMYFWGHASSHVHSNATASSGQITIDSQLFPDCFGYGVVDPSTYNSPGISSSHRRHEDSQALLGLALPGPGEGDAVDPMLWGMSSLDAEFLEHPGDQPLE